MADFKTAYDRTARIEGGYQCEPDDNGNWTGGAKGVGSLVGTNYGITAPELKAYLHRNPTVSEMRNISLEIVEHIYKNNYWDAIRGDEINDQDQANALYDSAVNMGTGTAILLAKRAAGIEEDTHMDHHLLNHLNNIA